MNGDNFKNQHFTEYDLTCASLVLSVIQVAISIMTLIVLTLWVMS